MLRGPCYDSGVTIAIACTLSDGVVVGADSALTINVAAKSADGQLISGVGKVYNDAEKLFQVSDLPVAAVIYGVAYLGQRSLESYFREFALKNDKAALRKMPLSELAEKLYGFLRGPYQSILGKELESKGIEKAKWPSLELFLSGFSPNKALPETWGIAPSAETSKEAIRQLREPGNFGANWGGMTDAITRFVKGYDPALLNAALLTTLKEVGRETDEELKKKLEGVIQPVLNLYETAVPFIAMPLQQGIDYVKFLLDLTISQAKFVLGAQSCGGSVRVAVVKNDGFAWVTSHKYELRTV